MVRPPNYKVVKKLKIGNIISAQESKKIEISDKKVLTIFVTSIKKNNSGGGYISTSQNFAEHRAYVIVMEEISDGN